jgi:AraC-like DNA-binding protein
MILFDAQRPSDSPFVELVWCSHSEGTHPFLSIAQNRFELVISKFHGSLTVTVRGPETRATSVGNTPDEGEWIGILLKPGTFPSPLPVSSLVDGAIDLPMAANGTFWLGGSAWQFPDYENAEFFVRKLVHEGLLVHDPIIDAALYNQLNNDLSARAVQYRFLQATGITQNSMRQIERARYATCLLQQGLPILDTVAQAGYYDQPHLTRALKHLIGQTPAQLLHHSEPDQLSLLYKTPPFP